MNYLSKVKQLVTLKRLLVGGVIVVVGGYLLLGRGKTGTGQTQYQTEQASRGTLINSISASGNVTSGNSLPITTSATGVIGQIYVKNGDGVSQGQKIADITLDLVSSAKQASAWTSYLSAQNQVNAAKANLNTLQSAEFKANQAFINGAVAQSRPADDPAYIEQKAEWLAAEANYKNQLNVIGQAQSALGAAWLSYQQVSAQIVAPTAGTIANLSMAPGMTISLSGTSTANTLGQVVSGSNKTQATVNLSEVDSPKIKVGQKVTMSLDAFVDKTYTGSVLMINTNGQTSSGVNTYPAIISFDTEDPQIYPNMAVNAKIVTEVKPDVILVLSSAVQNTNGQTSVRVMKNNQVSSVPVGVGSSNDTQTEIISGISEGDTVVTSVSTGTTQSNTTSPFGAIGGNRNFGGGGGGAARIIGR